MDKHVVIVAGGSGKRMGSEIPKQFLELSGKPVLMHTINQFYKFDRNINIILVLPESQIAYWKELCERYQFSVSHTIVTGGAERFYSVKNGINTIVQSDLVAIHDGVRPLVSIETIQRCFEEAEKKGNAIPVLGINESIRYSDDDGNYSVDRNKYKIVQTPQIFQYDQIKKAYEQAYDIKFTDDASVVECLGIKINLTEGNKENIKITTSEDLSLAERYFS